MMKGKIYFALILCVFYFDIPGFSQVKAPVVKNQKSDFQNQLDRLMPELLKEFRVPGATIAVVQNGKVALKSGYGLSDQGRNKKVTPQTVFNVGSISKVMTAWGVMKLIEQGKLSLDAPVEQYLTRWHFPESKFDSKGVTVRRLLSHTAGLSVSGYPGLGPNDRLPSLEESLSGKPNETTAVRIILEPGTKLQYSGGGYTLLQLLIEEVTKQNFADYMQEEILKPLGMKQSSFQRTDKMQSATATAYNEFGEAIPSPRFTELAAAGLYTTMEDFTRFMLATLPNSAGQIPSNKILKPESVALMQTAAPATDGRRAVASYSIGKLLNGEQFISHGGANMGWMAIVSLTPQSKDGIAIFTNGTNGAEVLKQVYCHWAKWKTGDWDTNTCRKSAARSMIDTILSRDAEAAKQRFFSLKQTQSEFYDFNANQLNSLGSLLLRAGKTKEAIEILKLSVEANLGDYQTYASLAEGYLKIGDKALAIKNYEKSLELNPKNENAIKQLKALRP